ncbi:MAG: 30S ribosomal protein S17 [candidate division Zixibacteria bacterium]|nr:30S ribosomal protein S17 [candidate division Zixibacteria bacterium]MBU1471458.1 30S ribosomal protein S17 [candidate division Zixibacteria bacterium]MBU2625626.1 30S ribosomal protein S17 [candidate division Zixibacteria bacterium]
MVDRASRKMRQGVVVSSAMNKTITVELNRTMCHPIYDRVVRKRSKLYAHDENNECGIGDKVQVAETRPLSKMKRWRLVKILEKAK